MIDFLQMPLWVNLTIGGAGGIAVWLAGTRLAILAEALTKRTRLTQAWAGLLLLAVATSLPEVATSVTASLSGNAELAANNLVGGVAMQTTVLAIADAIGMRGALTYFSPGPVLLMQAVLLILLLAIVIAGAAAGGGLSFFGVGIGTMGVAFAYVAGLYVLRAYEAHPGWKVVNEPESPGDELLDHQEDSRYAAKPVRVLFWAFGTASLVVLGAGWLVASVADAVAVQSGIGASFIGATLLALASSMPELSTTIQATRQGAYRMAMSNIFGSCAVNTTLLFVADVCYREGPILAETAGTIVFTAALGIVLTCVYLGGLLERGNRSVFRLGWDSAVVVVLYAGGVWTLYGLD